MKIIKDGNDKNLSINTVELTLDDLSNVSSSVSKKILSILSKQSMYPKQLAKELKLHEQNVYYYIRKLEKAGFIEIEKTENINGTFANYYKLKSDSFFIKFGEFKEAGKLSGRESDYLNPFVKDGSLNALIVVGSPEPHGPQKARSRDGYFGMDLALLLGSFLSYIPESRVRLDTEITDKEINENNLIILGGPTVNKVSEMVNNDMQVYFNAEKRCVYSKITKKEYFPDETGYINKFISPFNKEKQVLLVAGIRNMGTKAAILAFLKHFTELQEGNKFRKSVNSRVVDGIDLDSDGVVDDVDFLE